MNNLHDSILSPIRSAWRFRWWGLLTAWVVCVAGWLVVLSLPNRYEATASVYVDVSSRLDQVIGGVTIERDIESQLNRVKREMLGRPVLEVVARETNLDRRAPTPEAFASLLSFLQETIVIRDESRAPQRGNQQTDSILSITFHDSDRDMALAVVQQLLDTFVEDVMQSGQSDSQEAQSFLEGRIAEYGGMLRERERALAGFKKDYVGLLPGESGGYFARLQTYMYELDSLEAELRTAVSRRDALRAQLKSENPVLPGGILTSSTTTGVVRQNSTEAQISELEDSLYALKLRFTERHPDVLAVQEQLDGLYEKRQQELRQLSAAAGAEFEGSALSSNPVYQSIQMALNGVKVEIAAKQRQVAEHQRRIANLRAKVDVIPEIEAKVVELTRDYDQVKEMHDALVGRLEKERLGTAAERSDLTFRIIEPPVAGLRPASPARLELLFSMLVAGLGAGVGLALLAGRLWPVFGTTRELREYTGLPVVGSVSRVWARAHKRKTRYDMAWCAAASALLLVVFAGVVIFMDAGTGALQSIFGSV